MSFTAPGGQTAEPVEHWWHLIVWGVITLAIGFLLLLMPVGTALFLIQLLAMVLLVGAVVDLIRATIAREEGWGWHIVGGALAIIVALLVLGNPVIGMITAINTLYLFIAAALLVTGFIGLFADRHTVMQRLVLSSLQIVVGVIMLAAYFSVLPLSVLVQTVGVVTLVGGIAVIASAFRWRSRVEVPT